jgi:hypothetical protein
MLPVQLDRARDVPNLVQVGVLVHLGDKETLFAESFGELARRDEHRLRVTGSRSLSLSLLFLLLLTGMWGTA